MALELAQDDDTGAYEDIASKFFEHFLNIADSINSVGGKGNLYIYKDIPIYIHLSFGSLELPLRITIS